MVAKYYDELGNNIVQCHLCPHECIIHEGKSGICMVRSNIGGTLVAETYGSLTAANFDPIEKKPLFHFHPGMEIFSLGSVGCNFKCSCCQNYHISQTGISGFPRLVKKTLPEIISAAKENPYNIGIAYTYNEPSVWYEYMFDIAVEAQQADLKNVMVSNGFLNPKPLRDLIGYFDAFNIDLKAFDEKIYKKFTSGNLSNVLDTLGFIVKQGKHLEVTFLAIPGLNDDMTQFENMVGWINYYLGDNIPLHLSRYFPQYKMTAEATPETLLQEMALIAGKKLKYVYIGNVPIDDFQNTMCPQCGHLVIGRRGYFVHTRHLNQKGNCIFCDFEIAKV